MRELKIKKTGQENERKLSSLFGLPHLSDNQIQSFNQNAMIERAQITDIFLHLAECQVCRSKIRPLTHADFQEGLPSYYSNEFVNEQYRRYLGENRASIRLKKVLNKPINAARKIKSSKKSCPECSASAAGKAKVCKSCGYEFKTAGRYLIDRITQILRIDRVFEISKQKTLNPKECFFTASEIEKILKMKQIKILMFMNLDNMEFINETSLIELGEMLTKMGYHKD